MPTNTKPKPKDDDAPSVTEEIADEVTAEQLEYPEGTPELRSVHQLSRRERGAYFDAMAEVEKCRKAAGQFDPKDDDRPIEARLGSYAEVSRMMAALEDVLAVLAADPAAFRAWAAEADDADLAKAFNVYQRKAQPGEAPSSPS